jgi:hypothetical protein
MFASGGTAQQLESREIAQLQSFVEDQAGLDPATVRKTLSEVCGSG